MQIYEREMGARTSIPHDLRKAQMPPYGSSFEDHLGVPCRAAALGRNTFLLKEDTLGPLGNRALHPDIPGIMALPLGGHALGRTIFPRQAPKVNS